MAASSFPCFPPSPFLSSPKPNHHHGRRIPATLPASSSNNWWAPLLGWSSDADYIRSTTATTDNEKEDERCVDAKEEEGSSSSKSKSKPSSSSSSSRFSVGCFTEEKAKELRMKMIESANFHDIMYHSPIASRLASHPIIPPPHS